MTVKFIIRMKNALSLSQMKGAGNRFDPVSAEIRHLIAITELTTATVKIVSPAIIIADRCLITIIRNAVTKRNIRR